LSITWGENNPREVRGGAFDQWRSTNGIKFYWTGPSYSVPKRRDLLLRAGRRGQEFRWLKNGREVNGPTDRVYHKSEGRVERGQSWNNVANLLRAFTGGGRAERLPSKNAGRGNRPLKKRLCRKDLRLAQILTLKKSEGGGGREFHRLIEKESYGAGYGLERAKKRQDIWASTRAFTIEKEWVPLLWK